MMINFDDCDPETANHVKLTVWYNRFTQFETSKKRQIKNYCLQRGIHQQRGSGKCQKMKKKKKRSRIDFD